MAKIPLRAYTKEIDGLIDRGQYEQALAHCRYILKFIPKHIDTYRLMAKAYLESQRYGDASDVFQRVLSSIPDDFVSQLGMSIIREDEGNLDAAIWHMERAFEIQPSNGAIQSELRRLYGRRDGIEPPKIRLTRGALARMYFKGELYPQAINELRAALAADPQRPDLQLLLAKSYARAGHKAEAVTACSSVLNKLPYCIEANRIQAEILENTGRVEDAQVFRQRAVAMNPYLGQINPKALTPDQVPDEAVVLERLDWMPDKGLSSQPRWAASLGVNLGSQAASQEDIPDWLQVLENSPAPTATEASEGIVKVSPFVTETEETTSDEHVIPDWMKEAGWEASSGDTTLAEMGYSIEEENEEADDEGLAPAEIPSWLSGLAPEEEISADQPSGLGGEEIDQKLIEALDSAALPWLEETTLDTSDTITGWLSSEEHPVEKEAEDTSAGGLPDWLVGATAAGIGATIGAAAGSKHDLEEEPSLEIEESASAEFGEEFSSEIQADSAFETPDWLSELDVADDAQLEASSTTPAEKGELPEWLVGAAAGAAASQLEGDAEDDGKEQPELYGDDALAEEAPGELPDWLASPPTEEEVPTVSMVELPDWLEDTPPDEGDLEVPGLDGEDLSEDLAPESAQIPDWLSEAPVVEAPGAEPVEIPEWMSEVQLARAEGDQEAEEGEDSGLPEFLLGAAAGAALGAAALARSDQDEIQESASPLIEEEAESLAISDQQPDVSSTLDKMPEEISFEPQEVVTPEEEEAAFAWLEGLAAKQGVSEALFLSPDERLDEPPEWIQMEAALAEDALILGAEGEPQLIPDEDQEPENLLPPEFGELEAGLAEPGELVDISPLEDVPTDTSPEEFLPDWLRAAGPESEVVQAEAALGDEGEIPAWLSQMEPSVAESLETSAFAAEEELSEEESLDWLPELSYEVDLEGALEQGEDKILSDWLSRMPAEAAVPPEEMEQTLPELQSITSTQDSETEPERDAEDIQPFEMEVAEEPAQIQTEVDEIPGWAAGAAAIALAMDHEVAPEEVTTPPEEPELAGGIPDWLEEPEPGPEATPAGISADRLEIEEPAIAPGDTQPSATAEISAEQAEPASPQEEETAPISAEEESVSQVLAEDEKMISDEDAAFAWLESLAVKQGATEALLLSPEERLEEPPEWVLEESLTAEAELSDEATLSEAEQGAEAAPGKAAISLEAGDEPAEITETEEDKLPAWLIGAGAAAGAAAAALLTNEDEKSEAQTQPDTQPEIPELVPTELDAEIEELIPEEALPELPDWLVDLEPEPGEPIDAYDSDIVEEAEWTPEMADVESISEAVAQEKMITPLDINKASLIEIERLPGVGFRRAQALVEYRQQNGPFESLEQLSEVTGFDTEMISELTPYLQVTRPATPEAEVVGELEVDLLIQARAAIYKADIDTALQNYQLLIQQKHNLPEIVKDLEEALFSYPVDPSLWMTLGDAQMRAGQLHKAFDAYNKADELIV